MKAKHHILYHFWLDGTVDLIPSSCNLMTFKIVMNELLEFYLSLCVSGLHLV